MKIYEQSRAEASGEVHVLNGALAMLPPLKPASKKKAGLSFGPKKVERLTEQQAADWLGKSIYTLRRIRKRGEIGYHKIGSTFHYTIDQLEAYLKSTSVEPCLKTDSKSETITSPSTATPPFGKPLGSTAPLDKHAAHLWAQKTFLKQK